MASVMNVLLDYILIRFTPLGVIGAALATVISQWISVVLCIVRIKRSSGVLSEGYDTLNWDVKLVRLSFRMGLPMAFRSSVISLGVVLVQSATNDMGTAAIAAYAAGGQIDGIAVEPLRSLGFTMTTYVAQNYGAKEFGRIRQGMRQCIGITIIMSVILGVMMLFGGRLFAAIFVGWSETEILSMAHRFLIIHGLLYIILALLFDWRSSILAFR